MNLFYGPRARTLGPESILNLLWTYREPNYDASLVDLSWIYGESIVNLSQMPTAFFSLKNKIYEKYENWSEMGPYGSVWADIKTGRSPMAHDHFQFSDPAWPSKGLLKIQKNHKKNIKVRAKPAKNKHVFW